MSTINLTNLEKEIIKIMADAKKPMTAEQIFEKLKSNNFPPTNQSPVFVNVSRDSEIFSFYSDDWNV